jgi:hypothetical protein
LFDEIKEPANTLLELGPGNTLRGPRAFYVFNFNGVLHVDFSGLSGQSRCGRGHALQKPAGPSSQADLNTA